MKYRVTIELYFNTAEEAQYAERYIDKFVEFDELLSPAIIQSYSSAMDPVNDEDFEESLLTDEEKDEILSKDAHNG